MKRADIVIAACGRMEMVKGSWIKPGAAVRAAPDPPRRDSARFENAVTDESIDRPNGTEPN